MSAADPELEELALRTQAIYERNAARFDRERPKRLHEQAWLDRWLAKVPNGGRLLDLGCGAGDPIASYLIQRGFVVTGLDFSEPMLAIAREKMPSAHWIHADMRLMALGRSFHAILGWNSFFHLTQNEQRHLLPLLSNHLLPGGSLMLTVGPEAGEVTGHVGDDLVYHASLDPSEYRQILEQNGLELDALVSEDPTCDHQTILLAHKRSASL